MDMIIDEIDTQKWIVGSGKLDGWIHRLIGVDE